MMTGIILYKSKYGTTKKYAEWLSIETGFNLCDVRKAKIEDVKQHDIIIFGGGIYASGIAGIKFLKKNIAQLKGKKIIVFCDGASLYEEKDLLDIKKRNLAGALFNVPFFYFRGAFDIKSMSFIDRTLCRMLINSVAKKDPSEYGPTEKALMEFGEQKCDWTDKEYLTPVLDEIKK